MMKLILYSLLLVFSSHFSVFSYAAQPERCIKVHQFYRDPELADSKNYFRIKNKCGKKKTKQGKFRNTVGCYYYFWENNEDGSVSQKKEHKWIELDPKKSTTLDGVYTSRQKCRFTNRKK